MTNSNWKPVPHATFCLPEIYHCRCSGTRWHGYGERVGDYLYLDMFVQYLGRLKPESRPLYVKNCPACGVCIRATINDIVENAAPVHPAAVAVPDAYQKALDAALSFIGDVAPGASWWDDVWPEHDAALLAAQQQNDK